MKVMVSRAVGTCLLKTMVVMDTCHRGRLTRSWMMRAAVSQFLMEMGNIVETAVEKSTEGLIVREIGEVILGKPATGPQTLLGGLMM